MRNKATGDGSYFYVTFGKTEIYTSPTRVALEVSWHLEIEGITNQDYGQIEIETSNAIERWRYPNLKMWADLNGCAALFGKIYVDLDAADTLKLGISFGTSSNPKSVSIAKSSTAFLDAKQVNTNS